MPPSAQQLVHSTSIEEIDEIDGARTYERSSIDRSLIVATAEDGGASSRSRLRSRKPSRGRHTGGTQPKYDPRRSQQHKPTCRVTVELPPWYADSGSSKSSVDQGRLRVHSHLPIWQSSSLMSRHGKDTTTHPSMKVFGHCHAASTSSELFGPSSSSRNAKSGSIGVTYRHVDQQRRCMTLSFSGIQPEYSTNNPSMLFPQQDSRIASQGDCLSSNSSNSNIIAIPSLLDNTWQQREQLHQPHLQGSIYHTTGGGSGGTNYSAGASWRLPMVTAGRRRQLMGSVSVSRATTIAQRCRLTASFTTRSSAAMLLLPTSLDCSVALSPSQTIQSTSATEQTNSSTMETTREQKHKPHQSSLLWTLRLGTSLSTRSGSWLQSPMLQLRLVARRGYALMLSWGAGWNNNGLSCRCDCTLWSSSHWRLSVFLWSRGLRWSLTCGPAITLQLPMHLSSSASSRPEWWWTVGGSLVLSLVQYMLDRALVVQRPSSSSTTSRSLPNGHHQHAHQARIRAQTQQRLMERQATRQTEWERQHHGLVIQRAVYYSSSSSLDVTIPLQFWVHASTLQLYASAPRRQLLGFCALNDTNDSSSSPATALRIEYTYGGTSYVVDGIAEDEAITLPNTPLAVAVQPMEQT